MHQCCYDGAVEFGTAQLWKRTVPTIFQAMEDWAEHKELGFFKCTIQEDVMQSINPTKIGRSTVNASGVIQSKVLSLSSFPQGDALVCKVLIKEDSCGPEFRAPDLDVDVGEMDYRKLFCSTIDDAKAGIEKPYFVFDAFSTSEWRESVGLPPDSYLDCGDQLNKTPSRIPGVHSAYSYFSTGGGSCTAMHVEDGYLGSINFVLAGAPKVWLFVQPCFREKFESRVREWIKGKGRTSPCSQFVRHQDVLLSPELLDRWEIPYYIVPCKAGEMIVTLSQTYHQVVNAGANLSEAVNFAAEPDWTEPPSTYRPCTMRCTSGEAPITAADLRVRDNADGLEPKPKPSLGGHGSDDESNESQDGESVTSSNTTDASVDPFDKTVKDVIDDALRSELPYDGTIDGRGKPASSDVVDDTAGGPASKTNLVSANSASTQEEHQATFGDGSAEAPLRLKDEPNDHTVDSVKLPLGLAPVVPPREVKMSLKERIDSLVELTCQYQSVLEISEGDLDRFRPGRKLNDIGIKKALDIILPDKTEPLIASWAIRGFQSSALSEKHKVEELGSSSPQLVHDMDSTHLFIVYNVENHSLKQPARGSGNHWVLIIVDFLDKKINFYGAKGGLELTARTISHNTGVFVNAYRVAQGSSDDEIEWKPPRIQQGIRTLITVE
ncbi:hypothetical protein SLS56_001195 [Neofusicoccum ribis]|uniref:JmjC domain-containing protein n=1 Tax=Neofusicoccum ribis TaxID=45134 RepID=A0ABR3T9J7_9PEZI